MKTRPKSNVKLEPKSREPNIGQKNQVQRFNGKEFKPSSAFFLVEFALKRVKVMLLILLFSKIRLKG